MTATNRPVFNLSRLFVLAAVIAWALFGTAGLV